MEDVRKTLSADGLETVETDDGDLIIASWKQMSESKSKKLIEPSTVN